MGVEGEGAGKAAPTAPISRVQVEAGEKRCDGRAADDRVCKHLQLGDFFVGVSGARHLLLQVEHA